MVGLIDNRILTQSEIDVLVHGKVLEMPRLTADDVDELSSTLSVGEIDSILSTLSPCELLSFKKIRL